MTMPAAVECCSWSLASSPRGALYAGLISTPSVQYFWQQHWVFRQSFCDKGIGQFLFVKLEQALKNMHFHVYVECSKMELLASFDGSQYSKNKTQSHFTRWGRRTGQNPQPLAWLNSGDESELGVIDLNKNITHVDRHRVVQRLGFLDQNVKEILYTSKY